MKEIFWRRWCIREDDSLAFALRAVAKATLSFLVPAVNSATSSISSLLKISENMVHPATDASGKFILLLILISLLKPYQIRKSILTIITDDYGEYGASGRIATDASGNLFYC
ncbi:hypothetical protein [Escherichia coli]|uniref:hypothetical protein n=1 Tax=Escherichia coli TaxID=562 RepID=UPI0013E2F50E|nr:hypothetical protein [Escherichia coli]